MLRKTQFEQVMRRWGGSLSMNPALGTLPQGYGYPAVTGGNTGLEEANMYGFSDSYSPRIYSTPPALLQSQSHVVWKISSASSGESNLQIQVPSNTAITIVVAPLQQPEESSKADLIVTSFTAPSSASALENIKIVAVEQNISSITSEYHDMGIYLADLDGNILKLLSWCNIGYLTGGESKKCTFNLLFNADPGDYFLVGFADDLDEVIEISEENNFFFHPFTIVNNAEGVDLVVLDITSPKNVEPNKSFYLSATEMNQGSMTSDDHDIGLYLADEYGEILSFIGFCHVGELGPGKTSICKGYHSLDVPKGDYNILAWADDLDEAWENNENNNKTLFPITVSGSGTVSSNFEDPAKTGQHNELLSVDQLFST